MASQGAPADMYMNFVGIESALDNANTTVLTEEVINTGLSVRGALIWLIHLIEFFLPKVTGTGEACIATLCTRQDLATMPLLSDHGVISKGERRTIFVSSGGLSSDNPIANHYLPPVPIAAPRLSLYAHTEVDDTNMDGDIVTCRIGFTTAPLTAKVYAEIAEAWGW